MSTKLTSLVKEIIKESNEELDEINLMTGDADKSYSIQLLNELIEEDDKLQSVIAKIYGRESTSSWNESNRWYSQPGILDAPADGRIRAYIKSKAVDNQGALYIITTKDSERVIHHLFKLDEPVRTMYVGKIATEDSTGRYSMKTMFGVNGKVVHWSNFAQEYKGYGYGKFLYDSLLYRYGVLESDSILYQGSQKMWMYHMPKVSKFFGGTVLLPGGYGGGSQSEAANLVIPLTPEDVASKPFVRKALGSFVAFYKDVPKEVTKVAALTKGLSYRDGSLGIAFYDNVINDAIWNNSEKGARYDDNHMKLDVDQSLIEWLDSEKGETSFEELIRALLDIADVDYQIKFDKAKVLFILAEDATIVLTKKGQSFDYILL